MTHSSSLFFLQRSLKCEQHIFQSGKSRWNDCNPELWSNQEWFKYLNIRIFETNQNVVIWLVKWFDLGWFKSGCIKLDLKILADLICDIFFHLEPQRWFLACNSLQECYCFYFCFIVYTEVLMLWRRL